MKKRILVADVDPGPESRACSYGLQLARRMDADLTVLAVVPETHQTVHWMGLKERLEREGRIDRMDRALRAVAEEGRKIEVRVTRKIRVGVFDREVKAAMRRKPFHLVVLGGAGEIQEMSVPADLDRFATRLGEDAGCPVVTLSSKEALPAEG